MKKGLFEHKCAGVFILFTFLFMQKGQNPSQFLFSHLTKFGSILHEFFFNKNFCFLWNFVLFCLVHDQNLLLCMNIADICNQGILKGEVSLYHWPPVWLVWISLFLKIKTKIVCCHTADSKPVKQEVTGTVILPPLVFLAVTITQVIILLNFNLRD
jgi:hypothetical protein